MFTVKSATVAPFVDDPRYLSALGQLSGGCSFEANRNVVPMSNPF